MYRFVDRPLSALERDTSFLTEAMRSWVAASSAGRCPCAALTSSFIRRGAQHVMPDFGMAMAALNIDGLARLHFAPPGYLIVNDDEARLLALFAAGHTGESVRLRRLAAGLVEEDAVVCLMLAVERVGTIISSSPLFTPRNDPQS